MWTRKARELKLLACSISLIASHLPGAREKVSLIWSLESYHTCSTISSSLVDSSRTMEKLHCHYRCEKLSKIKVQ